MLCYLVILQGCTGGTSKYKLTFSSVAAPSSGGGTSVVASGTVLPALNPASVSSTISIYDSKISGTLNTTSGYLNDQLTIGNSFQTTASLSFPAAATVGGIQTLRFLNTGSVGMEAQGVLPAHFINQFTIHLQIKINSNAIGQILNYGSDLSSDLMTVSVSGTTTKYLHVRHQSTAGNYYERIYNIQSYMDQLSVLTIVAGSTSKDLETYMNGFRLTDYTAQSSGTAAEYSSVLRHLYIGGTQSADFNLSAIVFHNTKLSPQTVYKTAKYQLQSMNIFNTDTLTLEIVNDSTPAIEPDAINYTYVSNLILANQCVSCHRSGSGSQPYLDSYSNILTGTNLRGEPTVVANDLAASRIYQTVLSNSMPQSGAPLNASQKNAIKVWIENGAPN